MKKILIVALLLVLASTATTEIVIEEQAESGVWTAAAISYNLDLVDSIGPCVFTEAWSPKDTADYYEAGLDTVLTPHRIVCDTNWHEKGSVWNGKDFVEYELSCDTVYRMTVKPRMEKKIVVKLSPDQLSKLIDMLDAER